MEIRRVQVLRVSLGILAGMWIGQAQTARAGWTGLINGAGIGWGSVNVSHTNVTTHVVTANKVTTPSNTTYPTASIQPFAGYTTTGALPSGASTSTYAKSKGGSGGVWSNSSYAAAGDGTDDPELENRVPINPANCASLTMDSIISQFSTDNGSGVITVNTTGSAGTALWLRGFEYDGSAGPIPIDDTNTPAVNESVEFLKQYGVWKFETLIVGPFNFGYGNGCPLLIPFTLDSKDINNLIFVTDGVTKTTPLMFPCPQDITVSCGSAVQYPAPVPTSACGTVSYTYSLPQNYPFPVGTTPVTVTGTDQSGATASCTFNVKVSDLPPIAPNLPDLTLSACTGPVTPPAPTITDRCTGNLIYGKPNIQFPITTLGTTVVTWTFTDAAGKQTSANQNIIVTGLTFQGFLPPIGGINGSCQAPVRTINTGSVNPVKFNLFCGTNAITSGPGPEVIVQMYDSNCNLLAPFIDVPAVYQNNWHINWDTSTSTPGIYRVTVILPDGTRPFVVVKLK